MVPDGRIVAGIGSWQFLAVVRQVAISGRGRPGPNLVLVGQDGRARIQRSSRAPGASSNRRGDPARGGGRLFFRRRRLEGVAGQARIGAPAISAGV